MCWFNNHFYIIVLTCGHPVHALNSSFWDSDVTQQSNGKRKSRNNFSIMFKSRLFFWLSSREARFKSVFVNGDYGNIIRHVKNLACKEEWALKQKQDSALHAHPTFMSESKTWALPIKVQQPIRHRKHMWLIVLLSCAFLDLTRHLQWWSGGVASSALATSTTLSPCLKD